MMSKKQANQPQFEQMIADLESCLITKDEEELFRKKIKINDPFPVNL